MKNIKCLIVGWLTLFSVLSCPFEYEKDEKKQTVSDMKSFASEIVIREKNISYAAIHDFYVEGNILYIPGSGITAYDLEEKKVKWRNTDPNLFKGKNITSGAWPFHLSGEYIFLSASRDPWIAVVNKETGQTEKLVSLGDVRVYGENMCLYNGKLFFLGRRENQEGTILNEGVYNLNLTTLVEKNDEPGVYIATLECIKSMPRDSIAITGIHGDGKYGYFAWYPVNFPQYSQDPGNRYGIACIDLETGATVWEDNQYNPGTGGRIKAITDKYVFATVTEEGTPRGRGGTGVYYKEKRDGSQLKDVLWYVWSSDTNFTWDQEGKRIYLASGANTESNPLVAAIICIDAEEGTVVWKRFRSAQEPQIGMQPQVRNGVLYQVTSRYLELYDAQTGTPLGRDRSVSGDPLNIGDTAVWNDILIFQGYEDLFGVKMNWKIENGALVKE
ncbi:hypothetical protein C5O22_06025 [Treponema sp. J25]|nr:hypothetical protein C5O22_06025 [Treponema sp. J25]